MSLDLALAFTLKQEGGYVDNPHDHGGATNHGITQATYDTYRFNNGLPSQPVKDITYPETQAIYSLMYWVPAHCGELSPKLGICHFDWAVNHGVTGATETLQEALHLTPDGVFGPRTRAAFETQAQDEVIHEYLSLRRQWYRDRAAAHPDQAVFLKGWLSRVDSLDHYLDTL